MQYVIIIIMILSFGKQPLFSEVVWNNSEEEWQGWRHYSKYCNVVELLLNAFNYEKKHKNTKKKTITVKNVVEPNTSFKYIVPIYSCTYNGNSRGEKIITSSQKAFLLLKWTLCEFLNGAQLCWDFSLREMCVCAWTDG